MTTLSWLGIGVYAVVVAGWWLRHLALSLPKPLGLIVDPAENEAIEPCLSIIIPARNERNRIGPCLESVLSQGAVVRELIVVDDRSDDGTSDFVRQIAGGDPRLRVVRVDALPSGWSGKAHACHVGAQSATGAWLLFTDADCRFFPGALAGAVRYAERHNVDFLSLWLRADHRSFWEHTLIPLCGALILYWFPPFRANRRASSVAFANGQFILAPRAAYERIGGHGCSRQTVIEDIPLAEHAKQSGLRVRTALGPDIAHVRMYTCFREIIDGWTRIYIGALRKRWKLAASVISLLGGSLFPSVGAAVAAIWIGYHGLPQGAATRTFALLMALHFVAVYSVSFRAWGLCRCDRRHLLLYPVSVVVVMAIFIRAAWWMTTRRQVIWRGTPSGVTESP